MLVSSKSVVQGEHGLSILTGVEFVVKPAETIALIGESGSGKSTLLAIIWPVLMTARTTDGAVHLCGQRLHSMDEDARLALRAQNVGFVFQSFMLVPTLNPLENVELPSLLRGENSSGQQSREYMAGDRTLRSARAVPDEWLSQTKSDGLKVGK